MGGRGEGWVYSVDSAVLDYDMGRRLGKERNERIEMTVAYLIYDFSMNVLYLYLYSDSVQVLESC